MKRLLFFILAGISLNASAQYFDNYYQPGKLGSGLTTISTGDGHLLAGVVNSADVSVIKTDISGAFLGTTFKKGYHFIFNNHDAIINETKAIEYSSGNGFAVVATFFTNSNENGVLFINLSTTGAVNTVSCYTFGELLTVKAICESTTNSGDIFATGDVNGLKVFAFRMNSAGVMLWGYVYTTQYGWTPTGAPPSAPDPTFVTDIIQTPYLDPTVSDYPVVVVGGKYNYTALMGHQDWNGLWMSIDPNTGLALPVTIYDSADVVESATDEYFTGIVSTPNGYYISGMMNHHLGISNNWVTNISHASATTWPNVVWTNFYPSPFGVNSAGTKLIDIKYRGATNELYAIGNDLQFNGDKYETLVKLNSAGNSLTGRYYNRGAIDPFEPVNIDLNTAGTADGVSLYGYMYTSLTSTSNQNILKTYFNGIFDCSSYEYSPAPTGVILTPYTQSVFAEEFTLDNIVLDSSYELDYTSNCYAEQVDGGSNGLTAIKQAKANSIVKATVYPNPANLYDIINIKATGLQTTYYQVTIIDMLGRELFNEYKFANSNILNTNIDLSKLNLTQGMYTVKLISGNQQAIWNLMIK